MCSTRRYVGFFLPLLALLILTGAMGSAADASTRTQSSVEFGPTASVQPRAAALETSSLLVKFRPGLSASARASTLADVDASLRETIADIGVDVVTVPAARAAAALRQLGATPRVSFVEPDRVLAPQEQLPNDPYFLNSGSWNLGGGAWGWYVTHTTQAWDITQGDPSVVIAILDTGIKTSGLTDFGGQISSTWNVMTNNTDATTNAGNHGTYVAGVAALAVGNGVGNAGYCPKCRLMVVQVGTDSGASLSDLASGVTYAADHGARVANLSWAGASDSSTLQSAINYAHNKGLVITAAAGNSNCDCKTYPSGDQNVLGVAGVSDAAGDKQGDSNFGSWVKVAAPEDDMTAWPSINGAPGYAPVGGTSVAAPAVAGIAGLLFSYNPSLTNSQVEQALESTAAPVNFNVAYGRVDALAALQSFGATDPQQTSAPVLVAAPQIYYETNGATAIAPLSAAPQVGQVLVRGVGGWVGSAGIVVSGLQWQRCKVDGTGCTTVGNLPTYAVQSADAGYAIRLSFTIGNGIGSTPAAALTQLVGGTSTTTTTTTSSAPMNTSAPGVSGTAQAGQTLTATTGTWSGSPTGYSFQWQDCNSSGGGCTAIAGAGSSSYAVQSTDVGLTLRVVVTASNAGGSTAAASAPTGVVSAATTTTTTPATITTTFSASLNPGNPSRTFSITVGAGLTDAKLSFSKCGSMSVGLSNGASASGPPVVTLDSSVGAGTYTYTVTGGKCSFTLTVTAPAS
jgi:thermitase